MSFSNAISADSIVVAAKGQLSNGIDGDAVILNLKSGMYHGLDGAGARIWELVEKQCTVTQICGAIVKEYDVDFQSCEQDVLALLNELAAAGLIEIAETPAES